jgi:hypothetical protein
LAASARRRKLPSVTMGSPARSPSSTSEPDPASNELPLLPRHRQKHDRLVPIDLGTVWLVGDLYEQDFAAVRVSSRGGSCWVKPSWRSRWRAATTSTSQREGVRTATPPSLVGSPCPVCKERPLKGRQTVCSGSCRAERWREKRGSTTSLRQPGGGDLNRRVFLSVLEAPA